MKWLTTEYIQAQAKKGRRQALEATMEHWEQMAKATWRELVTGMRSGKVSIFTTHCALCARYYVSRNCGRCILKKHQGVSCGYSQSGWPKTRDLCNLQYSKGTALLTYPSKKNYPAFHREAKKMLKVLKDVHKKLYKK